MIKYYLLLFYIVLSFSLKGQNMVYPYDESVMVIEGGNSLRNPWSGGFNSAQFSAMDLNQDGLEDLVIFERSSDKLATFIVKIEEGNKIYVHEPRYEKMFPSLSSWMLLVDYNMDGKKDIFAHTNLGIMIFRNTSPPDSLTFQLMVNPLYSQYTTYNSNVMVNLSDIPAILDIDDDGDIDILNFNFFNGSEIEFHKNFSIETYGNSDSLKFIDMDDRWGGIKEDSFCHYKFGPNSPVRLASTQSTQHTGAAFLGIRDVDGDGDKEAFISKEGCDALFELLNKGSSASPLFNSFTNYPSGPNPVSFVGMPAVFFEDLDFDGIKDMIATPTIPVNNTNTVASNIDFQQSCRFYKNNGTNSIPNYSYMEKNFLQKTIIDVGENASPAFADYDADGDYDMFVANKGLMHGASFYSTISLYENTGDSIKPQFNLVNTDYLNLSSKLYLGVKLAFADINGDKATDITFTCYNGSTYSVKYILNANPEGQPFLFNLANIQILPLTLKMEDNPYFYDVDKDDLMDVLLARQSGKISYFNNIGSGSAPSFVLWKDTLGGITVDTNGAGTYLSLAICDLSGNGLPDLITGDNRGTLNVYKDFQNNLGGIFPKENLVTDSSGLPYSLGKLLHLSSTDLNKDSIPELFIGNNSGGVLCLNKPGSVLNPSGYIDVSGIMDPKQKSLSDLSVSPNPAQTEIYITSSEDCRFTIIDMLGNIVRTEDFVDKHSEKNVRVDDLKDGLYLIKFYSQSDKSGVLKLIILK